MVHGDEREGKWRGNCRMECRASTLHTTSERVISSITTADGHTSPARSWLNWPPPTPHPGRFKRTRPFRPKDEIWFLRMCRHISTGMTGHGWQYGACALHAGYVRVKTDCPSSVIVAARTHHDVLLYENYPSWWIAMPENYRQLIWIKQL